LSFSTEIRLILCKYKNQQKIDAKKQGLAFTRS
jgi:hypothetical protein